MVEPGEPPAEPWFSSEDVDALINQQLAAVPRPVDWSRLGPDEAAEQWAALDRWVRWLVARYAVDGREVPPCWYQHGALVEELTGLRGAQQVAWDPTQAASAASDWHRTLWDTRVRLRDWLTRTGCTARSHRPDTVDEWATSPGSEEYETGLTGFVLDDTRQRATRNPAEPDPTG